MFLFWGFFLVLQLRVEVSDFWVFFSPKKYDDGPNFTAVEAVEMITAPFVWFMTHCLYHYIYIN